MSQHALPTIVMLIILIVALPLMGVLTRRRILTTRTGPLTKLWRYARTIFILWSLTALAFYALRLHGLSASDIGMRPPHHTFEYFLGLVFVAMLVLFGSARRKFDPDYRRGVSAVVPETSAQWVLFIPLAASAGICEEFLYRGYALWAIYVLSGSVWAAALLSSLAFGLGHAYQGRAGIIGAITSGLFYAAVYLYTGSLLPCMLGHCMQDIAGALILRRALNADAAAAPEAA